MDGLQLLWYECYVCPSCARRSCMHVLANAKCHELHLTRTRTHAPAYSTRPSTPTHAHAYVYAHAHPRTQHGVNPSYLYPKKAPHDKKPMLSGQTYTLHAGDSFTLLPDDFRFTFVRTYVLFFVLLCALLWLFRLFVTTLHHARKHKTRTPQINAQQQGRRRRRNKEAKARRR